MGWGFARTVRGAYCTSTASGFLYRHRDADRATLAASSPDELLASINAWTRHGWFQVAVGALAVVAVGIAWAASRDDAVAGEVFAYGAIGLLLARFLEQRLRRFVLAYDLGPRDAARYDQICAALAALAASGRFRAVANVGHQIDWKRNAGATRTLMFVAASLRRARPPLLVTSVVPWCLRAPGAELYFLPDRILARSRGAYVAVPYPALGVDLHTSTFVWDESVPHDAQVVGETWQFVRKDGGPDGRFKNNRRIPLVRAGYLELSGATGTAIVVQTTAIAATEAFRAAQREHVPAFLALPERSADNDGRMHDDCAALGLPSLPSVGALKEAYRELALRDHADRFAKSLREVRQLAAQRAIEVYAAFERLLPIATARSSTHAPSSGPAVGLIAGPPIGPSRAPEILASAAALFMAVCVAVGAHAPKRASRPAPVAADTTPIAPPAAAPAPAAAVIATKALPIACPVRGQPSPKAAQIARLAGGTQLALLESRAGWWRVRDGNGVEGWTGPLCWQPPRPSPRKPAQAKPADQTVAAAAPAATEAAPVDPYAGSASAP